MCSHTEVMVVYGTELVPEVIICIATPAAPARIVSSRRRSARIPENAMKRFRERSGLGNLLIFLFY